MFKRVVASSVLLASLASISVVNADLYEEISCSTDAVFGENSCNQCFDGWVKAENSTVWGLSDLWINEAGVDRIAYKETQTMPEMKSLNGAVWSEDKVADAFWKYTSDFDKLLDNEHQGYILKPGQQVTWIESTEGSSYVLSKNTAPKWENVGLLVYTLKSSPILENGELTTDEESHRECVLFKSGDTPAPVIDKPKQLPKTGPEQFFLLLLLAMFLAFGILRFKKS